MPKTVTIEHERGNWKRWICGVVGHDWTATWALVGYYRSEVKGLCARCGAKGHVTNTRPVNW